MAGMSDYLENAVLNMLFGNTAYTVPVTLYVGLSTTAINDDGTGITEPVGNNYARVAVTNTTVSWNTSTAGTLSNKIRFEFPKATASWGIITYMFIADAATEGNILVLGKLTEDKAVGTNDTIAFDPGDMVFTLD